MPLYIKITSPKIWVMSDFTDSASYDLELKIYTDPQMTVVKDLTGFTTTTLRFVDPNDQANVIFSTTTGLTGDANGVLLWKPTESTSVYTYGHVKVHVQFKVSGTRVTAIGVNGSDDLFIKAY